MTLSVTDPLSHSNDHVKNVAEAIRRSGRLKKVFIEIYRGKKNPKPVSLLMKNTGLTRVGVLQQGARLVSLGVVSPIRVDSETSYKKVNFWIGKRTSVVRLAANKSKLDKLPTKYSQKAVISAGPLRVTVSGGARVLISEVTVDDFEQFARVRRVDSATRRRLSEAKFKQGIQRLIGEAGKFQDWGGEKNDLFTSRLRFKGKRRSVAFAFKGPGMKGILTPKKLGKRGDQIQRLFGSAAEVFLLQYHDQIDESVVEQMRGWAKLKSLMDNCRIWFGTIDGQDTDRLVGAYSSKFR